MSHVTAVDVSDGTTQAGAMVALGIFLAESIGWLDAHSGAVVALCAIFSVALSAVSLYWRSTHNKKG